jgi:3-deoxy-D-manno-octulosonic-acid transferase
MMLALYSLATWLLQPLVRRKAMRRAAFEPLYGERIDERFGVYPAFAHDDTRPLIWIHAVSLGETRAAAILLGELRKVIPTMRLLLTSGTATGRTEGAKLLQAGDHTLERDVQVWQPWDTRGATQAFFAHFKPALGILMETELWPNLIHSAADAGIPVVLVNARLSDKSLQQSQRWWSRSLASQAYKGLAAVYAQTADDAMRLRVAGAKVAGVFGNLKFDITPNAMQLAAATQLRAMLAKPVVVFASSREGEEALFLAALQALPAAVFSQVHWLIVPRHPQRFDEVAGLIATAGFAEVRRSRHLNFDKSNFDKLSPNGYGGSSGSNSEPAEVWLGDSLGEMAFYYGLSSVALLGGSFAKLGGQNLIEALACGCPVVMGEHTFNFEEAASLAATAGVAFRADGLASAITQALALCRPHGLDAAAGFDAAAAYRFVEAHRGSASKTATAMAALLR